MIISNNIPKVRISEFIGIVNNATWETHQCTWVKYSQICRTSSPFIIINGRAQKTSTILPDDDVTIHYYEHFSIMVQGTEVIITTKPDSKPWHIVGVAVIGDDARIMSYDDIGELLPEKFRTIDYARTIMSSLEKQKQSILSEINEIESLLKLTQEDNIIERMSLESRADAVMAELDRLGY